MVRMLPNGFGEPRPSGGRFTREENDTLRAAIDEYCAENDITPSTLATSSCKKGGEQRGAWTVISQRLPERTRESVYRRGLRMIHPFETGRWSDEETARLRHLVERHGKSWKKIQQLINRSAENCADKYRELERSARIPAGAKPRWDDDETDRLRNIIRETLGIADPSVSFAEMAGKVEREGSVLPFTAISKRLGSNKTRLNCYDKWLRMTGRGRQRKLKAKGTHVADGNADSEVLWDSVQGSPDSNTISVPPEKTKHSKKRNRNEQQIVGGVVTTEGVAVESRDQRSETAPGTPAVASTIATPSSDVEGEKKKKDRKQKKDKKKSKNRKRGREEADFTVDVAIEGDKNAKKKKHKKRADRDDNKTASKSEGREKKKKKKKKDKKKKEKKRVKQTT